MCNLTPLRHSGYEESIFNMSTVTLASFSDQLATLTAHAAESIVAIHARPRFNSSGIHWSAGIVVTAEHTIRHDNDIIVTSAAGTRHQAEIVGRDPGTDLAILRVKELAAPTAQKSTETAHRPGSLVLAVGRNKESSNAALGVLSSVAGSSQTWRGGKLDQVIRVDITLHPAAAGGAIIDVNGNFAGK